MKKEFKNNQDGRSMVEMLGVLAIIGVLSVGGISGYSKAMTKFKVSKTMDQVSMTVANIRTMYSGQRDYTDLTTTVAVALGIMPSEMVNSDTTLLNAFQGSVTVTAGVATDCLAGKDTCFVLTYNDLPTEVCTTIVTADWGSGSSSGLIAMSITGKAAVKTSNPDLPITPAQASLMCDNGDDQNIVSWIYF